MAAKSIVITWEDLVSHGEADLVNYRVKGHFYIVDRLFDRAELRVGKDPQTIVAISRKAADHRVARAAAATSIRSNK